MAENQVQNPPAEKVIALSASLLEPFQGHPFQVASGEEMEQLMCSTKVVLYRMIFVFWSFLKKWARNI